LRINGAPVFPDRTGKLLKLYAAGSFHESFTIPWIHQRASGAD
jgi:hypothetical protein